MWHVGKSPRSLSRRVSTNFETGFMSFDTCFQNSFRCSYLVDWYYIKSLDTHTLRENAFLISRNRFSAIQRTRSESDTSKVFFEFARCDLRASLNNRIPVHAFSSFIQNQTNFQHVGILPIWFSPNGKQISLPYSFCSQSGKHQLSFLVQSSREGSKRTKTMGRPCSTTV